MDVVLANRIINFAKGQATPAPYGCVNDSQTYVADPGDATDPDVQRVLAHNGGKARLRFGWRNLKTYFEVGGGWGPDNWKDVSVLEGVMLWNKKIPQPGTSGIDWCGVFSTYCWIKGGVTTAKWGFPNVTGNNITKVGGWKGITIGDMAILDGPLWHHLIVAALNGPADDPKTVVTTINGNSDYQGITIKTNVKIGDIKAYVTYHRPFEETLKDMYGTPAPSGV